MLRSIDKRQSSPRTNIPIDAHKISSVGHTRLQDFLRGETAQPDYGLKVYLRSAPTTSVRNDHLAAKALAS